ncbi:hypothetical protein PHLCEN_2v3027 [Hermanssonia centrifuga]|uniref:Uncharacterized protein n=1 Tax=Hermanssonia centrifuga TaxID=98765 RepID=A0A2R6R7B4_9APHY|nr:hypothetical protein PHLCEN_2v3027 [Hermanssonia centrifuga]
MAGTYLKRDPAIDSFSLLYLRPYTTSPKTKTCVHLALVVFTEIAQPLIPQRKWDWKGKKKGESLRAGPKPEA